MTPVTRHTFEQVKKNVLKQGVCPVCGEKAARSTTFMQTLNPFNKGPDGTPKDRWQIEAELNDKARQWQDKPVIHAKCEPHQ